MKEAINTTLEMFICMIIGAALGACIVYSNMRDKKEEISNSSNVPDEFLVTENDVDSSEFFVTVYTCEDVEKFKINYAQAEYNKEKNKVYVTESNTHKEFVFNSNEYKVVLPTGQIFGCDMNFLTENDIEKIRYEGKKRAEELFERMESNIKKENAILAIAEEKVKAGIPLNTEERDAFVRKIHLEEFHKIMEKH
jgi:hypothetical protein